MFTILQTTSKSPLLAMAKHQSELKFRYCNYCVVHGHPPLPLFFVPPSSFPTPTVEPREEEKKKKNEKKKKERKKKDHQ